MTYKLSKFSYSCKNNNGDLLLFNSLTGLKSICKIKTESHQANLQNNIFPENDATNKLLSKGIIVDSNLNEDLKLKSTISEILSPPDLSLTISPTEACNFRCKYCYESHDAITMNEDVRDSIILFVRNNMHKFTKLNISWFGGEPLVALDSVVYLSNEFINICQYNRRKYTSTMTTNGYLLNVDTFNTLLKCRVLGYQISIDGLKSTHDNQRPLVGNRPTFETIIYNLRKIKQLKERNFHIVIRSNITRDIYNDLDDYLKLLSEFCENDSRFSVVINYATEWSDNLDEEIKDKFLTSQDDILSIYKKIINEKINIGFTFLLNSEDGSCQLGRGNRYFFRPNGEIHKCTIKCENPDNIIGRIENGNVKLNHKYYDKLLNPNMCDNLYNCFYAPICKGEVCPSIRKTRTMCPTAKMHLGYYLQLMDNYSPFEAID